MMTGMLLGLAMLVPTVVGAPETDRPRGLLARSAVAIELPADRHALAAPRISLEEQFRPASRGASRVQSQPARVPRFSLTERIIAVAAGTCVGWFGGGAIGWELTKGSHPDDDTSGLRGVIVGAPLGAAVGAFVGFRLTR